METNGHKENSYLFPLFFFLFNFIENNKLIENEAELSESEEEKNDSDNDNIGNIDDVFDGIDLKDYKCKFFSSSFNF